MARFTSIGMPKKSFVASAAEEAREPDGTPAGPSKINVDDTTTDDAKKRERPNAKGKEQKGRSQDRGQLGWGRDANLAKRVRLSVEHAEARRQKRQDERYTTTTCFACRSVGHAARDCPNVLLAVENGAEGSAAMLGGDETSGSVEPKEKPVKSMKRKGGKKGGDVVGGRCYRCNSTNHSLGHCPEALDPANPTPFATCYICLATGHLSSLCPSNPGRGIYVNGGSCKICSSTAHRAKDCPDLPNQPVREETRQPRRGRNEIVLGGGESGNADMGADEDDFMIQSREELQSRRNADKGKGKRKKHPPANNAQRGPKEQCNHDESAGQRPSTESNPVSEPQDTPGAVSAPIPMQRKAKPKVVAF